MRNGAGWRFAGTIRFRLTAWYTLTIAVMVSEVAIASWFAMRDSLNQTIDKALARNVHAVRSLVVGQVKASGDNNPVHAIQAGRVALALRGTPIRLYDKGGRVIYESDRMAARRPGAPPALIDEVIEDAGWDSDGGRVHFRDMRETEWPVRFAYGALLIPWGSYAIEVAEPLSVAEGALQRHARTMALGLPIVLALAALGGFWIAGRTLAPVERITADACAITAQNLSERLAVPKAHDELRRLSETLNAMLDRIEGSVRQMRQFTADASHELRAPLALIQTAAEFSLRRERPREELVDAMQKIHRESARTGQIIDNLLLLARADADTAFYDPIVLDLSAVCRDVAEQAHVLAAAKCVDVTADLSTDRVDVKGDEPSLRRVLLILVDNAIKYTPEGGRVGLALATDGREAVVRVTDTGVGIAPVDQPRVFDRFWRADKVRSRALGGAGLGLAIARWLVERHDGTIAVDSEIGRGSTFTVRLPVAC